MSNEIQKTLINTFGRISYLAVIFFLLTFILFIHNDISDPLKESWTAGISFLSVLSTLGAAYIASKLYSHWREVEQFKAIQGLHNEAVAALLKCSKELNRILGQLTIIEMKSDEANNTNNPLSNEHKESLTKELFEVTKEVIINVQSTSFDICVKIAMDYTKPLNNDQDLKFMFETLNNIKNFVQKIARDRGLNDNNLNEIKIFINNLNAKIDKKIKERN